MNEWKMQNQFGAFSNWKPYIIIRNIFIKCCHIFISAKNCIFELLFKYMVSQVQIKETICSKRAINSLVLLILFTTILIIIFTYIYSITFTLVLFYFFFLIINLFTFIIALFKKINFNILYYYYYYYLLLLYTAIIFN